MTQNERLGILRSYAAGEIGTGAAIERLELRDFADLLIAMAQNDLSMPRPADTPGRRAHVARARSILQPLLRRGD